MKIFHACMLACIGCASRTEELHVVDDDVDLHIRAERDDAGGVRVRIHTDARSMVGANVRMTVLWERADGGEPIRSIDTCSEGIVDASAPQYAPYHLETITKQTIDHDIYVGRRPRDMAPPAQDASIAFDEHLPACFKGTLSPRATASIEHAIDGWTVVGALTLSDASPTFPPPAPIAERITKAAAAHGCEAVLVQQGTAPWANGPASGVRLLPEYHATCLVHAASCGL